MTREELKAKREAARRAEEERIASFYRPLTPAEKAERERRRQINRLKHKLAETDYCVIKIAEGEATVEEYSQVLEQRRSWRVEINQLESELE